MRGLHKRGVLTAKNANSFLGNKGVAKGSKDGGRLSMVKTIHADWSIWVLCVRKASREEGEWALQNYCNFLLHYFSLLCLYFFTRGECITKIMPFTYLTSTKGEEFRCGGRAWQGHSLGPAQPGPEALSSTRKSLSLCNNCILCICWRTASWPWSHCSSSVPACKL